MENNKLSIYSWTWSIDSWKLSQVFRTVLFSPIKMCILTICRQWFRVMPPVPYNVHHTGVRTLTELDRIPHEKRVLLGKKLDHRVRKHGRIWDFSGNPFFQVDGVLYSHCKVSCGSYLALACFFLTSLSFWPAIASRGSGSLSDWEWVKTWVNYLDWGMIINPCVECNIRMMVGWL
jgi:hypothetical protein